MCTLYSGKSIQIRNAKTYVHCGLVEFAYLRIYVYNMLVNIMHLYNILDIGIICPKMWMFVHVHV